MLLLMCTKQIFRASQVELVLKNLPANAGDMWVPSLGQDDPLEEGMATHTSILTGIIPWTEEPDRFLSMASQSDKTGAT